MATWSHGVGIWYDELNMHYGCRVVSAMWMHSYHIYRLRKINYGYNGQNHTGNLFCII